MKKMEKRFGDLDLFAVFGFHGDLFTKINRYGKENNAIALSNGEAVSFSEGAVTKPQRTPREILEGLHRERVEVNMNVLGVEVHFSGILTWLKGAWQVTSRNTAEAYARFSDEAVKNVHTESVDPIIHINV